MKDNKIEYCINNLASLVVEKLIEKNPSKTKKICEDFYCSKTYLLLVDKSTKLWTEGPDYVLELYKDEIKNK